jgi:Flp pilus assembly protein TadD
MSLGVLHQQRKALDAAREAYRKVLGLEPNFVAAANNLAWLEVEHGGNVDVALGHAQRAKEAAPDHPSVADTLGWIYYHKGVYATALGHLSEAAEKMPDNPTVRFHLGMTHAKMGKKEDARRELERALEINGAFPEAQRARDALKELGN